MFRELGAGMLVFGVLFLVIGMWGVKSPNIFLFEMVAGPIFIYFGLQLLK